MLISISEDETGAIFSLEVSESTSLNTLQAFIEAETGIDPHSQSLLVNLRPIPTSQEGGRRTVSDVGISDGDVVIVLKKTSSQPSSSSAPPGVSTLHPASSTASTGGGRNPQRHPGQQRSSNQDRLASLFDFSNIVVKDGRATASHPPGAASTSSRHRQGGRAHNPRSLLPSRAPAGGGEQGRDTESSSSSSSLSSNSRMGRGEEHIEGMLSSGRRNDTSSHQQPSTSSNRSPSKEDDEVYLQQQAQTLVNVCTADEASLAVLSLENPPLGALLREAVKEAKEAQGGEGEEKKEGKEGAGEGQKEKKKFKELIAYLRKQLEERRKAEIARVQELNEALRNPLSAAAQAFMMRQIHEKQVEDNYLLAQEHLPESFGSVFMLYIDIEINGVPLKAFVDSGAQSTFISYSCAEKCSLTRIMDTRFRGIAQGVGRTEILGKIHMASLKIGKKFYPSSFTVLQDDKVEFLFGLDLLRRYQCCIDLHKHVLRIGEEEVPFLSEKDITKGMFGRIDTPTHLNEEEEEKKKKKKDETGLSRHDEQASSSSGVPLSRRQQSVTSIDAENSDDQKKVQQLVDLGFLRTDAVDALEQAGGNVEVAASLLFHSQQELKQLIDSQREKEKEEEERRRNDSNTKS
ncbi:dna-damage inducible [Cystoisospora suis]|uniref:Dna-damage inducible n=1 Tax=Cystoisospora suis TaxID=483139 RepID=A0A2C6L0F1_9APIC|nr:dna-damage inducible [Cystoisospora suis]